jgi:triosephosphate isomerase
MPHQSKPFLIAGNWKMNLSTTEASALASTIADEAAKKKWKNAEIFLAPTYVHLLLVKSSTHENPCFIGAQDCSHQDNGAHTGDISAAMLKDMECDFVILGHSERRQDHNETNALIKEKVEKAIKEGLHVILCVGETLEQRESGNANAVVQKQLEECLPAIANGDNCTIAYEPVWAIGTGKVASPKDVRDMHSFIANFLSSRLAKSEHLRIIYGGSVKPENAAELFSLENVAGALIGGASLKADSFIKIAEAANNIK